MAAKVKDDLAEDWSSEAHAFGAEEEPLAEELEEEEAAEEAVGFAYETQTIELQTGEYKLTLGPLRIQHPHLTEPA